MKTRRRRCLKPTVYVVATLPTDKELAAMHQITAALAHVTATRRAPVLKAAALMLDVWIDI